MFRRYWRDLITFPGDAAQAKRLGGWSGVWSEVMDRTVRRIYRRGRMLVVEQPLDALPAEVELPGVEIREIGAGELAVLRQLTTVRTQDRFESYLASGGWCLVAYRAGVPIGYTWIAGKMLPGVESVPLDLPSDAAYGWALYVIPAERRNGIGSALVAARLRLARDRGYRKAWRAIRVTNRPALRTLEKTEGQTARFVSELSYVKLFSRFRLRSHDVRLHPGASP
jgi:GNAT superfamily N-acetyltransferase